MSLIQGGSHKVNTTAFYPTTINQSLRFEDGDSPYLGRIPSTTGDTQTWTFSAWVKRGNLTADSYIFSHYSNAGEWTLIQFDSSDRLYFVIDGVGLGGGTGTVQRVTTAKYRDPSAWYHIVVQFDTTQAAADERAKLYVNGEQITEFDAKVNPNQNDGASVNTAGHDHRIGGWAYASNEWDGYMAEVHFTDGTAYDADTFGELKSGIWIPKAPSVTYGTNGFYLDFADGAAIGDDESGNTNDWTATNLVASDVVPDSPTNNFCTMNPLNGSRTLSQGNLRTVATSATYRYSTFAIPSSGKWYWEMLHESDYRSSRFGFANAEALGTGSGDFSGIESSSGGNDFRFDDQTSTDITDFMTSGGTGVIAFAVDMDAGEFDVYLDGALQTSGTFTSTSDKFVYERSGSTYTIVHFYNFGQDSTFAGNRSVGGNSDANGIGDFAYAPPSGYLALCTSNLPDPVFDPAQDATPEDHFNVVTYTGDNTQSITGVGFQPDLVWVRRRSGAAYHQLHDSVRGATAGALYSNDTAIEQTGDQFDSFDSDGFTTDSANISGINGSGYTYVAWNWKAGGTGVSNTDGSITSTVSANTDAGFSIVGWTGNGTDGATLGHGLTAASPELIIFKNRDVGNDWFVMGYPNNPVFTADGSNLRLNTTAALTNSTTAEISIGSSVVTFVDNVDDINGNGDEMIAYCFHSVDGFSKAGSYTGNGSADGPFIYTGFRPKWVMIKRTDSSTGANWHIKDTERETYNQMYKSIYADLNNAENTTTTVHEMDFLSNGFKVRNNDSGANASASATYIFLAFAEQSFKFSNAR